MIKKMIFLYDEIIGGKKGEFSCTERKLAKKERIFQNSKIIGEEKDGIFLYIVIMGGKSGNFPVL